MSTHSNLSGLELHEPYHFVQETDPGALGSGKYWLQVSTGLVKRRNDANSGWVTISPSNPFADPLTTKGDLIIRSATVPSRLPIGTDGQVLTADATQTLGLKWATSSGGGGGGGYVTTIPASPTDTGAVGSYAADSDYLYICYLADSWKRVPLIALPIPYTATYASDGDTNGVFYKLGSVIGGGSWINPQVASGIVITPAGTPNVAITALTDRINQDFFINPMANNGWTVDLGVGRTLVFNYLSFRQRVAGIFDPTADLEVSGSNDNLIFTSLTTWTAAEVPDTAGVWFSKAVIGVTTPYRYFRFRQPATASYFTCGEIEMYGAFKY